MRRMERIVAGITIASLALVGGVMPGASAAPSKQHPRIFLTSGDIPRLRAMAKQTENDALGIVPAEGWAKILEKADKLMKAKTYSRRVRIPLKSGGKGDYWSYTLSDTPPPPHNQNKGYPVWTSMFQERGDSITTRIKYFMTAYVVTGDKKYFDAAKAIVMHLCAWPGKWTDPQYGGGKPCLDTGHTATFVGIFYDWGYDALTPEERGTIRRCLAEKALAPAAEHAPNLPAYHNFNTVLSAGLGIGALAILGEEPRAKEWVDLAANQMRRYMDEQGKDGGAVEGPLYGSYATRTMADLIWALDTADYPNDLMKHPFLASLPRFCISQANPNDFTMPTFGDGNARIGYGQIMRAIALQGDSAAAWYCTKVGALDPTNPRGFLALDPAKIRPKKPDWNPSDAFVDVGYAALRDGFKANSAYLAFKAGPPTKLIHHNQFDQNSFQINYAGYWVAGDPGYRVRYEKAGSKYTMSTLGHNSIVLDFGPTYLGKLEDSVLGHDQVSKIGGRIAAFYAGEAFDYTRGEAAVAYNSDRRKVLDRFDREIVFAKPGVFFVCDTIEAPAAHRYTFLLHPDTTGWFEVAKDGRSAAACSGQGALDAVVYGQGAPLVMQAAEMKDVKGRGPYLAATTPDAAKSAMLTAVLSPRMTSKMVLNPGFEQDMKGWKPRNMYGKLPNHKIDTTVAHSGKKSGRIDKSGYYYTNYFDVVPGATLKASFWAKVDSEGSGSTLFYFWKGKKAFANVKGPRPKGNEWKRYEFEAKVPEGAERARLALQFSTDEGAAWYDDADVQMILPGGDAPDENANEPAVVEAIDGGNGGAVCRKGKSVYVLLRGEAGKTRTVSAAGHTFETDASIAAITMVGDDVRGFAKDGKTLNMDGKAVTQPGGTWRATPEKADD